MARYVRFDKFGGTEVLRVVDDEPIQAGPGEVRVRVHSAGLNIVDWKIMNGGPAAARYNATPPCGNGNDFAGVVDQVGNGVTGIDAGDRVFGGKRMCAQADFVVTDPDTLLRMPDALDFDTAGCLDIAGRTAWASVHSLGLGSHDTVLVSAAAGGVGVLAAQLALRTGARVIGTASPANHEFLRSIGVIPVEYGEGLVDRLRKVAPRLTAALDNHGPATIDAALKLGVPGNRINTIAARGHKEDAGITNIGGADATSGDLGVVAALVASGEIVLPIDTVYPLERVRDAYGHLARGHLRGKIVLALV
ncbi:NADP-dependent oxidoreductase [Glaciibacter sp. 2TAF33]|uniref:NADP-dependent oxidoreductase n=1 Tax=Glaciibacter sp. 2TAF33 TaxID=3233015 RepID=UPI003F90B208